MATMTKRILMAVALLCSVGLCTILAADNPPSEASIKQLLEVGQAHKLVDTMTVQMDGYMKQIMQQATQGQHITPEIQKGIDKREAEMMSMLKEVLDWNKLEPMYVRSHRVDQLVGLADLQKLF